MSRQPLRLLAATLLTTLFFSFEPGYAKLACPVLCNGLYTFDFNGSVRDDFFYGRNISFLNSNNKTDQTVSARHLIDFTFDFTRFDSLVEGPRNNLVEFFFDFRSNAVWGNPNAVASTTATPIKDVNTVEAPHTHAFPRNIFWMRQAWLSFDIGGVFGFEFDNKHRFTMGAFPFALGRGIAFGDAYAVAPEVLGYWSDASVNQYALGWKLNGALVPSALTYDLYAAILRSSASSVKENEDKIYGQQYGRLNTPMRGFGKINYVLAARTNWTVFNSPSAGNFGLEPYAMFNHDPEQNVEVFGDAKSRLLSIGLAGEYTTRSFEFGFDMAHNFGQQDVKGLDRNKVQKTTSFGYDLEVNSHILSGSAVGSKIPFVPKSASIGIINALEIGIPQDVFHRCQYNGKFIGSVPASSLGLAGDTVDLYNAKDRYRDPYTNVYKGWMAVADAAAFFNDRNMSVGGAVGVSSGDADPNFEEIDGEYKGFIPLQEMYAGKRVRSAFLFGSAGKVKRPLETPEITTGEFSTAISGFTNIIFTGANVKWKSVDWCRRVECSANVMPFWEYHQTFKYDITRRADSCDKASTFLGTELNIFADMYLLDTLKLFFVGAIFVPGQHFTDIKGKPLNKDQLALLDTLDTTGFDDTQIPNIGDSIAFTLNMGMQFNF